MHLQTPNKQSVTINLCRSHLIAQNNTNYKDEFDHFNTLYKMAETKKSKIKEM